MVQLRDAVAADEPALRAAFAGTRAAEVAAIGGGTAAEAFLDSQYGLQLRAFLATPAQQPMILAIDAAGVVVGRLLVGRRSGRFHLVDVAILPERRGAGLGSAALRRLLELADASGWDVTLHVDADNPAVRLYERLGFVDDVDRPTGDDRRRSLRRPVS